MVAFGLEWQGLVVGTETIWLAKQENISFLKFQTNLPIPGLNQGLESREKVIII